MKASFLVAKYAPDLKRMEPRNIGVIVWANGRTASRFLGDAESGDAARIPKRVGVMDAGNYRDWVSSWRRELSRPYLELSRGRVIEKTSPEFMEGLREFAEGNYMLVNGGMVKCKSNESDELEALAEHLFEQVVTEPQDSPQAVEQESVVLKTKANDIWKSTGVWQRPDFRRDQPAFYELYGEQKQFVFDYAVGPSEMPYTVYHRVILSQQRAFDSTFLNLEHYRQSRGLDKQRCVALIAHPGGDKSRLANHRLLSHIARVVDVTDDGRARDALLDAAAMNGRP